LQHEHRHSIIGNVLPASGRVEEHSMGALYKGVIAPCCCRCRPVALTDYLIGMHTTLTSARRLTRAIRSITAHRRTRVTGRADLDHGMLHRHQLPAGAHDRAGLVTGHGTNVIRDLAISMGGDALPALVICAGIGGGHILCGSVRHRDCGFTMLSLAGMIVASTPSVR